MKTPSLRIRPGEWRRKVRERLFSCYDVLFRVSSCGYFTANAPACQEVVPRMLGGEQNEIF